MKVGKVKILQKPSELKVVLLKIFKKFQLDGYNSRQGLVWLYELTAPFELNIDSSNSYKRDKYQSLKNDIEEYGFKCHLVPFEIGSRGYISRRVKLSLCSMFSTTTNISNSLEHVKIISKLSLLSSFSIFHSRKEKNWSNPPFLNPWHLLQPAHGS